MVVPAVSRSGRREASGMIENLTACFDGLVDPRATRRCDHQLIDILVIAAIAVIACAESWEDIQGSRMNPGPVAKPAWQRCASGRKRLLLPASVNPCSCRTLHSA